MSVRSNEILTLEAYYIRNSAFELARRSMLGMSAYMVMAVFVVFGTPVISDIPVQIAVLTISLAIITLVRNRFATEFENRYERIGEVAVQQIGFLMVAQGLIWACLAGLIIWQYGISSEAALALTVTAGFSAGGSSALAVRLRFAFLYLAVMHIPIVITVLFVGGMAEFVLLLTIAGYTTFLIYLIVQINRSYLRHIGGQLELEDSLRKADAASQAKGEFLANVSHELRTLMNGVMGMTNLLMDTQLSKKQYSYGKTIRNSANSLLSILNDMLDYSKIEAGALEMERIDFNMRSLHHEITNLMAWPAAEKGIEYVCAIDPDVPSRLCGDIGRLRQVFINMISNAIKFTEEGSVTVWVSLGAPVNERVVLKVTVTDTGIGIPEDKLILLFKPYEQVETSITRKYGGTGLGLSICKHLIEIMDGEIRVESTVGVGSTFSFSVVLDKATSTDVYELEEAESLAEKLAGTRVLVADANEASRKWLRILLEGAGCRPNFVTAKDEIYDLLRSAAEENAPYRLAIVDLRLVGEDLDELKKWTARNTLDKRMALICMVPLGTTFTLYKKHVMILTKPVRAAALQKCLAAALLDATDSGYPYPPDAERPTERVHRGHYRILVADDDVLSQKVAIGILENAGYAADFVSNGREAIEALESMHYDLVLMDCLMPEMDGFEATRAIRATDSLVINPDVIIIALTALAVEGDRKKCFNAGMNEYLTKPVNALTLIGLIDQMMGDPAPAKPSVVRTQDPPAPDETVFDHLGIQVHLKWEPKLINTIIGHFLEDAPHQISKLHEAVERGDIDRLRLLGHRVRGSASIIAASSLSDRALALEEAAQDGDLDRAAELTPELVKELQRLLSGLARMSVPG